VEDVHRDQLALRKVRPGEEAVVEGGGFGGRGRSTNSCTPGVPALFEYTELAVLSQNPVQHPLDTAPSHLELTLGGDVVAIGDESEADVRGCPPRRDDEIERTRQFELLHFLCRRGVAVSVRLLPVGGR
jgi:hypothetical protein